MLNANIRRQAFYPDGTSMLDIPSQCTIGLDSTNQSGYCRYIRWQQAEDRWEEYWLGMGAQSGIIVVPRLQVPGATNNGGSKFITNAVVAFDIQPRNASPEVQAIGLMILNKELFAFATNRGLIPPWGGDNADKDILCCDNQGQFSDDPALWIKALDFNYNVDCWRRQLVRVGRKDAQTAVPFAPDGTLLGRLSVTNWDHEHGAAIPSDGRFERRAPFGNSTYLLEVISFHLTGVSNAAVFPKQPVLPAFISMHDYRPSNSTNRGYAVTYSSRTNLTAAPMDSKTYASTRTAPSSKPNLPPAPAASPCATFPARS